MRWPIINRKSVRIALNVAVVKVENNMAMAVINAKFNEDK